MFIPKTKKIQEIKIKNIDKIQELEKLLKGPVNMYIDYANILPWKDTLNWEIDFKRLKQFLDSFNNIKSTKVYIGTILNDEKSISNINKIQSLKYVVITKEGIIANNSELIKLNKNKVFFYMIENVTLM